MALLDGADQVALLVVVTLVGEGHHRTGHHHVGGGDLDDLGVLEHTLEVADAGLHLALLLLGGVVVAVLRQVPEFTRRLDLAGDLGAAMGGEFLKFGTQTVMGGLGKMVHVTHGRKRSDRRPGRRSPRFVYPN